MRIDVVTLFPSVCEAPLSESIMGRAREKGALDLHFHDLREHGVGRHCQVDALPYGGGQGMVLRPEPFFEVMETIERVPSAKVVLMTPQGRRFDQRTAERLAAEEQLVVLCGHYEGVDHRVVEGLVDEEISIGDYVLSNGAIAAAVMIDAIVRLIPGVLGNERSAWDDSFSEHGRIEAPAYTRPAEYRGMQVPEVLSSGNHALIEEWKRSRAEERTRENRPDLLDS